MVRLTEKIYEDTDGQKEYRIKNIDLNGFIDCTKTLSQMIARQHEPVNKLGQLEDIEEELGIDLITYFKIKSAKTVYVKELRNDCFEMLVRPSKDNIDVCYKGFVNIPECDSCLQLKDYGKTWALTRKELEK